MFMEWKYKFYAAYNLRTIYLQCIEFAKFATIQGSVTNKFISIMQTM